MSSSNSLPTKVIAGVTVVDTPLIQSAIEYARVHSDDMTYNHVMRAWLFGTIVYQKLHAVGAMPELDLEAHAVSAILHDLGWDKTGELVSKDKRFEVDGAIAARNWLQGRNEQGWDPHRQQLVWDSIALHTTPTISAFKEPVVQICGLGIICDFKGPDSDPSRMLTWDDFNNIKKEFPRLDLAAGIREKIVHFCKSKPETTYDNWQMAYGRKYVEEGFAGEDKLAISFVDSALGD